MAQAIQELLDSKRAANRRPIYLRALRVYLTNFARGREQTPIDQITRRHVFEWLASAKLAPSSYRTGLNMLAVLFSFSQRVGWVDFNPCSQIEKPRVERKAPRILTPAEVRKILKWVRAKMPWRLANIVLGVYAGIRPTELSRLYWSDIDLDRGFVRIDAAASKVRRRRIVHLEPKAIAWLKVCQVRDDKPIGSLAKTWKRCIFRNCGIPWTPDLLRHTAASYLLARHGDAGKIARMLGHSVDVLLSYYVDLVDPADCRRFWKCWRRSDETRRPH